MTTAEPWISQCAKAIQWPKGGSFTCFPVATTYGTTIHGGGLVKTDSSPSPVRVRTGNTDRVVGVGEFGGSTRQHTRIFILKFEGAESVEITIHFRTLEKSIDITVSL